MKVSKLWLDKFFEHPLPDAPMLAEALEDHAFEVEDIEKAGQDAILDVNITPNRGHDCLSHRGIAKELAAILKLPFAHDPLVGRPNLPETPSIKIKIEDTKLCPRY